MDKQIKKQFASAVHEGITSYLKKNPGSKKFLDWFTVLASRNIKLNQDCYGNLGT